MSAVNGKRAPRYLGEGKPPQVAMWIPIGSGDRLYVESMGRLPEALADELESYARGMRLLAAIHGVAISRIEVAPW